MKKFQATFLVLIFICFRSYGQGVTNKVVYFLIYEVRQQKVIPMERLYIRPVNWPDRVSQSFGRNKVGFNVPKNLTSVEVESADSKYLVISPEGGHVKFYMDNELDASPVYLINERNKGDLNISKGILFLIQVSAIQPKKLAEAISSGNGSGELSAAISEIAKASGKPPDSVASILTFLDERGVFKQKKATADYTYHAALMFGRYKDQYLNDIKTVEDCLMTMPATKDITVRKKVLSTVRKFLINPWDSTSMGVDYNTFSYNMSQMAIAGILSQEHVKDRYDYIELFGGPGELESLGGLDVTSIADGLANFFARRMQEELSIYFLKSLRTNRTTETLFPNFASELRNRSNNRTLEVQALENDLDQFTKNLDLVLLNVQKLADGKFLSDTTVVSQVRQTALIAEAAKQSNNFSEIMDIAYEEFDPGSSELRKKLALLHALQNEIYFDVPGNRGYPSRGWIDGCQFADITSDAEKFYSALVYSNHKSLIDDFRIPPHGSSGSRSGSLREMMKENPHDFVTVMKQISETFNNADESRATDEVYRFDQDIFRKDVMYDLSVLQAFRKGISLMDFDSLIPTSRGTGNSGSGTRVKSVPDMMLDILTIQQLHVKLVDHQLKLNYSFLKYVLDNGKWKSKKAHCRMMVKIDKTYSSIRKYLDSVDPVLRIKNDTRISSKRFTGGE
jgi:hypothetical protein